MAPTTAVSFCLEAPSGPQCREKGLGEGSQAEHESPRREDRARISGKQKMLPVVGQSSREESLDRKRDPEISLGSL